MPKTWLQAQGYDVLRFDTADLMEKPAAVLAAPSPRAFPDEERAF